MCVIYGIIIENERQTVNKIGYCTSFKLGDKVKPITKDDDFPIMTICAIQIKASLNGIIEQYQVDWFSDGAFKDQWVDAHQIEKV